MTGRKTITALAVLAMTTIGAAAQSNGQLVLINNTGTAVHYSVVNERGQAIPNSTGCLDIAPSVTLFGPAYANREIVYVRGETRRGGRGDRCRGATVRHTGNAQPFRMLGGRPTLTFTISSEGLMVR